MREMEVEFPPELNSCYATDCGAEHFHLRLQADATKKPNRSFRALMTPNTRHGQVSFALLPTLAFCGHSCYPVSSYFARLVPTYLWKKWKREHRTAPPPPPSQPCFIPVIDLARPSPSLTRVAPLPPWGPMENGTFTRWKTIRTQFSPFGLVVCEWTTGIET